MTQGKFNKAIHEIKQVKLTQAEKQAIFERVIKAQPVTRNSSPVASPWSVYSFSLWIQNHRWVAAVAVVVIVIFAGNTVVRASYDTLPGDSLYSFKVNIVEPVRVALAVTPTGKAEVQAELVDRRIQEAETLAARNSLDSEHVQQAERQVETQVMALTQAVDAVPDSDWDKAEDIRTTVEASVKAHRRIANVIALNKGLARSKQSERVRAKTTDFKTADGDSLVSATTAIMSASAVPVKPEILPAETREVPVLKTETKVETQDMTRVVAKKENKKFSGKKAAIKSLIETAAVTVQSTSTEPTPLEESIVNEARVTLNRAEEKLKEADTHNANGDEERARAALIDSERSAKEATVFIKAKVRLEKEVKKEEIRTTKEKK